MSKEIFEEKGGPHRGHAAGNTDVEKQASQLASDVKYKVKQSLGKDTKLNPAQVAKAYLAQLAKSPAPPAVKALAKRKLMGEEYTSDISELVEKTMMNALAKVFIEGVQIEEEPQNEYLLQLEETEDRKYKIRVTDKKTGNTYVRMATRAKIAELRANPNISSVEMTEYGEVSKSEASKGSQTAAAKSGKDYDGDGKVESGAKEYRGAVHNAIQRRRGGTPDGKDTSSVKEEFLSDAVSKKKDKETGEETLDVMKGKNNVNLSPSLGESKNITEKKMTSAEKKKENELKDKYDPSGMKSSMIQQYGKEKGPGVYFAFLRKKAMQTAGYQPEGEVIEEGDCGCDDGPKLKKSEGAVSDPREMKTKVSNVKNKLRSIGLNMSYEAEGEVVEQIRSYPSTTPIRTAPAPIKTAPKPIQSGPKIKQMNSYEPEGEQIDEMGPLAGLAVRGALAAGTALAGKAVYDKAKGVAGKMQQRNQQTQQAIDSLKNSYEPEGEIIDERRRVDKGTPRRPDPSAAFKAVSASMGSSRLGVQPRGQTRLQRQELERTTDPETKKKVRKRPAGEGPTPAQQVALRRAQAERSKEMQQDTRGT